MSEENQTPQAPKPNIELPKFELPKVAAPTIRTDMPAAKPFPSPVIPAQRPTNYASAAAVIAETKAENPAWTALDAVAAVVAISFAILLYIG